MTQPAPTPPTEADEDRFNRLMEFTEHLCDERAEDVHLAVTRARLASDLEKQIHESESRIAHLQMLIDPDIRLRDENALDYALSKSEGTVRGIARKVKLRHKSAQLGQYLHQLEARIQDDECLARLVLRAPDLMERKALVKKLARIRTPKTICDIIKSSRVWHAVGGHLQALYAIYPID